MPLLDNKAGKRMTPTAPAGNPVSNREVAPQQAGRALQALDLSPAVFVENKGQWEEYIRYAFQGKGANVLFTDSGPVFQLLKREGDGGKAATHQVVLSAGFIGANAVVPKGLAPSRSRVNYYHGNDRSKWQTDVPTFGKMAYICLYNGVDLYAWGKRSGLKYEFHIAPGASWRQIAVIYEGIEGVYLDESGALHVRTPLGEIVDNAPVAYQETSAGRVTIPAAFRIIDDRSYGFDISGPYDPTLPIILDPDLAWSSFLGGNDDDRLGDYAFDASDNLFLTGTTLSPDFPTPNGADKTYGGGSWSGDAFIAKVSNSGGLEWATYLGGSEDEEWVDLIWLRYAAWRLACDNDANFVITGYTYSSDFPTPAGFITAYGGGEYGVGFVAKISSSGQLLWASYLGCSSDDYLDAQNLDAAGNTYICGTAFSAGLPTVNSFQATYGGGYRDGYLAKVAPSGQLEWGSFLGGSGEDSLGFDVDASGNICIVGTTSSQDILTPNGFQQTYGGGDCDGYVGRVSAAGQLLWASFLGGSGVEGWNAPPDWLEIWSNPEHASDAAGNLFILGATNSPDFPTHNAFQSVYGGGDLDVFITKISPSGHLLWSTFLGGNGSDSLSGDGLLWSSYLLSGFIDALPLVGITSSDDFPTPGGFQGTYAGGGDAFIAKVSLSGELLWASYLGGSGQEGHFEDWGATDPRVFPDHLGNLLVSGTTKSSDFPTTSNGFQQVYGGGDSDGFVAKVAGSGHLLWESYLGGEGADDIEWCFERGLSGDILIEGWSDSLYLPFTSPIPPGEPGYWDGDDFVVVVTGSGQIVAGLYLGDGGYFWEAGVDWVDSSGNVFISGWTSLPGFPTPGGFQTTLAGGSDGFIWKYGDLGLEWGTYIGGGDWDDVHGVCPDSSGNLVILGDTTSADFPTKNAFQPSYGGGENDLFLAKVIGVGQPADLVIVTASLPDGQVSEPYSLALLATGGKPPYTWSKVSGNLPSGLTLNASTGAISGTPTSLGASNFTVRVTDSQSPADKADQALSITVNPADLAIATASLPDGKAGVLYSQTLHATGGVTPYKWSVSAGSLPAGLSINQSTGVISGTPTIPGISGFTVTVTDSWTPQNTDTQALSIKIVPADLVITTTSLADGKVGVAYSQTVHAGGGALPLAWSLSAGNLPEGLSLNASTGVVSGIPASHGISNFTVMVTDSWTPENTDTQALSIKILPADLVVTTTNLAGGKVGVAYSQTVQAAGGAAPLAWSVLAGSLPPGLSLNGSTGVISGITTTPGMPNFTVMVTDSWTPQNSDTQALSITIVPADLVIMTTSLEGGTVAAPYSRTVQATGGALPLIWSVSAGSLPAGLLLNTSTGVISGAPTAAGVSHFTIRVADSWTPQNSDTQALSITVVPTSDVTGPVVPQPSLSATPNTIREGVDTTLTLTALADDSSTGGSMIFQAEYFIGTDPGQDGGYDMTAADGAFDSVSEALASDPSIDTSAWKQPGVRIYVRAKDAAYNWGSVASIFVPVVDGTAPGAVTDLALSTVPAPGKIHGEAWQTPGSAAPLSETKLIDLGSPVTIGAVALTPSPDLGLFPRCFEISGSTDNVNWELIGAQYDYKAAAGAHLWQCEPKEYRYIRVTADALRNKADGLYYVKVSEVAVFGARADNRLHATWTATADDGTDAASGPASVYDLHYSANSIDSSKFASCQDAGALPSPKSFGQLEDVMFSIGDLTGKVYAALKVGDEVPNWSELSSVATADVAVGGLKPISPADDFTATVSLPVQFAFKHGPDVSKISLVFCDRTDFPAAGALNSDGTRSKALRVAMKPGFYSWRPTRAQWIAMKKMLNGKDTIYWRLEGVSTDYVKIASPTRAILFETGDIMDLAVAPSHLKGSDEAIWPDKSAPPESSWNDSTVGMKYFYVDVSTSETMPLTDRKATMTLGGAGITGASSYTLTAAEWKKLRKIAATSNGVLYWRVRSKDADKALTCASAVKKLIIDGGEWSLSDIDLSSVPVVVSWTHTGAGIVKFNLQFSSTTDFHPTAKETISVPTRAIAATTYALQDADLKRIKALALRNGVTILHYRVRGEDVDKAFVIYSETKTLSVR